MGKPTLYVVERKEIFVLSTIFVFVAVFSFILGSKYGQRMEQEKMNQAMEKKAAEQKVAKKKAVRSSKEQASVPALHNNKKILSEFMQKQETSQAINREQKDPIPMLEEKQKIATSTAEKKEELDKMKFEVLKKEIEKTAISKNFEEKTATKVMPKSESDMPGEKIEEKLIDKKKKIEIPDTVKKKPVVEKKVENAEEYYTIQVASFPTHRDASDYIRRLKPLGLKPYIMDSFPTGKQRRWYRVGVGKYVDQEEANKVASTYIKKRWIRNYFIRKESTKKKEK